MDTATQQNLAWLARSFGRPHYLPLTTDDLDMVAGVGEAISKYPGTHWLVAGLRQLEETQRRVIHLMRKTVLAQVADLLAEEGQPSGEVHLSQESMATLLGVSRQTVNESIGRLKELGAIETGYRLAKILDVEMLNAIADEMRS